MLGLVTSLLLHSGTRSRLCFNLRNPERAQTALETAFVFTSIIFLAFATINLGVYMHTRTVATYAAFMAARSYQVYGDHTGKDAFKERTNNGDLGLLSSEKTLTVIRTAEDIFTCALPWVRPPAGDLLSAAPTQDQERAACMEGERKYEATNINKSITFLKYEDNALSNFANRAQLEALTGGFKEKDREPMRYAIMRLQFKNRLLLNPYNVFDGKQPTTEGGITVEKQVDDRERARRWHKVYVPVLLNPGLESGVVEAPSQENQDEDQNENSPNN